MSHHYNDIAAMYQRSGRPAGTVLGIDPGPTESAYALVHDDYSLLEAIKRPNEVLRQAVQIALRSGGVRQVVIEGIACYGRPVGRETFETAYMVGDYRALCRLSNIPCTIYARPEYTNALAGCGKVTDAMFYQALRLRFGGSKKGEPLYMLKGESDLRSAYGLAVYWLDRQRALNRHDLPSPHTPQRGALRSAHRKRLNTSSGHDREPS